MSIASQTSKKRDLVRQNHANLSNVTRQKWTFLSSEGLFKQNLRLSSKPVNKLIQGFFGFKGNFFAQTVPVCIYRFRGDVHQAGNFLGSHV